MHEKVCGEVKKFLRYAWKTVKWSFIVFLLFVGSLFFREQRLPKCCIELVTDRLSSSNLVVSCESASYGFRRGLTLMGLGVYDLTRANRLDPVVKASSVNVDYSAREVRVVGVCYPRLPESYYASECRERNAPLEATFPRVRDFHVILERPEILGIKPERVSLQVDVQPRAIALDDIRLDWWPLDGRRLSVDGRWRIDLDTQMVTGEVRGLATQPHIRPLLEALDVPSAFPYFDAFTDVSEPVAAHGDFGISLARGDFDMELTLDLKDPRYRCAAFRQALGTLGVHTGVRGTNCNVRLTVDLPKATDPQGGELAGHLLVTYTNGVARLGYDVRSGLALAEALKVTGFLEPSDLPQVACFTPPTITVKGTSGTSLDDLGHNDLAFEARVARGAFMGFGLNDAAMKFALKGDVFEFREATATGSAGGRISAPGRLYLPEFDPEKARFETRITYADGSLAELAEFFKFDLGERRGRVNGWCELAAPATTNFAAQLNGKGHVEITEGHLAQMKLFAGLTSLLADKVPGVGFLVNQSQASADFTITNGVFRSDNVYIEGGFVSLKSWGTYDIPKDDLDFTVRVQFMKKESLMGKILHPVTFPFTKLLLEFKATGPIDAPKWSYITIIDRIL